MRKGRFHYKVLAEVEFTGLELVVLEHHARTHYDSTCQRFFDRGDTGYRWKNKFRQQNDDKEATEALEGTVTVEVTSETVDLCAKIIERLGYNEAYAMLQELTGMEMPELERKMGVLAKQLRKDISRTFHAIGVEYTRLDDAAKPAPKFDGQLLCPHCKSDEVEWQEYVLHTRQVLGVVDGELCVDMASEESVYESTKEEGLACKTCFYEFKIPEGLRIERKRT